MKSQKIRFMLVGALLFAVASVGYWVGYAQSTGSADQEDLQLNNHQFKVSQELLKRIGGLPESKNLPKPDNAIELDNSIMEKKKEVIEDDPIHVVDSDDVDKKPAMNSVNDKNSNQHVLDIHKGHAMKLSKINENIKKKKKSKLLDKLRGRLADHNIKQDESWVNEKNKAIHQENQIEHAKQTKKTPGGIPNVADDKTHYALIHSGKATRVHNKIHEKLKSMPDHISPDLYILQSKQLPDNERLRPSIGNGQLGTVIHGEWVFMNGVYNGYLNQSHRAAIPSTCAVKVSGIDPPTKFTKTCSLNLAEGMYTEEIISKNKQFVVTERIYAHRNITGLLVVEIDLIRHSLMPIALLIQFNRWTVSNDITFLKDESGDDEVSYKHGHINTAEAEKAEKTDYTDVHIYYDHVPDKLSPPTNSYRTKWVFITSIATTQKDALSTYRKGSDLIRGNDQLYATHVEAWSELWSKGAIHIEGNDDLARTLYASSYYLLSSLPVKADPVWPFFGLSPSGLPFGELEKDYQGHVFWDQETWMYPSILFFHADIAKILINTRERTIAAAKKLAQSHRYQGLQYPWESAFTGTDVTPSRMCSLYELHISGDISRAIMQYLYATNDLLSIHSKNGYTKILAGIADFWVSQLIWNPVTDFYEIKNVMPPDEKAGVVNNSVYTNTIAQMSIAAMEYIYSLVNKSETHWKQYADNIYIPFDNKLQYHPEYDGYYKGKQVKQADVILLGYPLNRGMNRKVRRNDLLFYEQATEKTGPAMTWCMYSIGWLELDEMTKGNSYFSMYKQYIQGDFKVWTEQPKGRGAANFLTGIGGFLQNIIAGYGGFRLHPNNLEFNPVLPPGVSKLNFVSIDYLGSSFDFTVTVDEITVMLTKKAPKGPTLHLYIFEPEEVHTLTLNLLVKTKRNKGAILAEDLDLPDGV